MLVIFIREMLISIHTPCEGGDAKAKARGVMADISIHTPCEGGDDGRSVLHSHIRRFQSTPPVRGVT